MDQKFNYQNIRTSEFFVCYDTVEGESYWQIPVDKEVQNALNDMLMNTLKSLNLDDGALESYEPAQKYSSSERLIANIEEPHMEKIRQIYSAENIAVNAGVVKETQGLAYYFTVFRDDLKRKIIAIRRATQFKGVIKARNRLISLVDDTLKLVPDDIFKLDHDFDYIVSAKQVLILHPTGFEYTAGIEQTLIERAVVFSEEVAEKMTCVDFTNITNFIGNHKRAARLIASIHSRNDLHLTSSKRLTMNCTTNGIQIETSNGIICPQPGSELAFLELLDRRRYLIELIDDNEEHYVAPNRRVAKITPSGTN